MNEPAIPAKPPAAAATPDTKPNPTRNPRPARYAMLALGLVALGSAWLAFQTAQRVATLEQELVRRQQDSQTLATEARVLAKQAQDVSREADAKVALLETRVAENTLQRSQFEELVQNLSRSRDENMLADIDAAVRVAIAQSSITGSTEPLFVTLKQADERLARNSQPRLERVRRALVRDLDRVRAVAVGDISTLLIKLDEAVRLVDELPLVVQPEPRAAAERAAPARAVASAAAATTRAAASATAASARAAPGGPAASAPVAAAAGNWRGALAERWQFVTSHIWNEVRSLVRVSRIEQPEAMLLAPEQAYFLRQNIKLRLLNARLALLSRQFATAQADLRDVQSVLDRYFERNHRRVTAMRELVQQVAAQGQGVVVPRPDESLAALAAALAGR